MDDEHYIDGDHNGGVFNHFNHNSYGYCYQSPTLYVDPNGKQGLPGAILGFVLEYAAIIGPKMLFEDMSFVDANKSMTWADGLNLGIATASGAFMPTIIEKFVSFAKSPLGREIIKEVLSIGLSALEDMWKQFNKDGDVDFKQLLIGELTKYGFGKLVKSNSLKKEATKHSETIKDTQKAIKEVKEGVGTNNGKAKRIKPLKAELDNAIKDKKLYERANLIYTKTVTKSTSTFNKAVYKANFKEKKEEKQEEVQK